MLAATSESFTQEAFKFYWIFEHFFKKKFKGFFANMVQKMHWFFIAQKKRIKTILLSYKKKQYQTIFLTDPFDIGVVKIYQYDF